MEIKTRYRSVVSVHLSVQLLVHMFVLLITEPISTKFEGIALYAHWTHSSSSILKYPPTFGCFLRFISFQAHGFDSAFSSNFLPNN